MRILYATDGSEGALCAGRFLAGLPHRRDIHVHIMTALAHKSSLTDAAREIKKGDAILAAARNILGGFPGHITTATARADSTGEIVDEILFATAYINADLIVLGANGHSGIARLLLGSVALGVARNADRPVLLARRSDRPLREVIVGVDGSESARAAAWWIAKSLPLPDRCALHLVRSVVPPVSVWQCGPSGSGLTELETEGALEDAIHDGIITTGSYLDGLAGALADSMERPVSTEVAAGNAANELMCIARERKAGLIVVGSQEMTGMQRFLLGSVSETVLRHAPCSVLVARRPPEGAGAPAGSR
ncbi:MAG: universal stress protein [Armatimonadota bacterium]